MTDVTDALLVDDELKNILHRRFRANPCFRLVEHRHLAAEQREALASLTEDPRHFGVLVPLSRTELGVQAVDNEAAALFSGLREPAELPRALRDREGSEHNRRVALLVLDGVLEIECGGTFASGPHAHSEVLRRSFQLPRPKNRIAELSFEVLRRAQIIPIHDAQRLCSWIYSSGVIPVGPEAAQGLGDWEAVEQLVGLDDLSGTRRELEPHYHSSSVPGWTCWHRSSEPLRYGEPDGSRTVFKLYVSPHPRALAEVFPLVVECLVAQQAPAFKLGRDAWGLFRPDKLMVYFDDFHSLEACAAALRPRLEGCPAHGVPFSAGLDEEGLLSWGIDPPRSQRIPGWRGCESWRAWLAARLARAILRARAFSILTVEPWICALDRIRVEGIDTDGWLPTKTLWQGAGEP